MGVVRNWEAAEARIRSAYARRTRQRATYSWSDPSHVFGMQEREWAMLHRLVRAGIFPLEDKRILEVGCGTGGWLRDLCRWGATPENVFGIELQEEPAASARVRCPPGVTVLQGSAAALDFPDASFDVVFQATVFTSILEGDLKRRIADEMMRVTRPGGVILWYDFFLDNPRNRDVKGVRRSEIRRLFPEWDVKLSRTGLVSPLRDLTARRSFFLAYLLSQVPWLCTHYIGILARASTAQSRSRRADRNRD